MEKSCLVFGYDKLYGRWDDVLTIAEGWWCSKPYNYDKHIAMLVMDGLGVNAEITVPFNKGIYTDSIWKVGL